MEPALQPLARYAVLFRVPPGPRAAGALLLADDQLLLVGRTAEGESEISLSRDDLVEVRIGRSREERLNGHATLVLVREGAPPVQVEPYGAGLLHELADLLCSLVAQRADDDERIAVVLPLKPEAVAQARELVEQGPPFDPAELDLSQHQVFLGADAATFVFVGPHVRRTLERVSRDPTLWAAGLAWRRCIAGRPQVTSLTDAHPATRGQPVYSWSAASQRG